MNTAPYSRILIAPDPPATGTTLTVLQDEGSKFPEPIFNALAWQPEVLPTPDNSADLTVLAINGDVFTLDTRTDGVDLTGNMMIAAVSTTPVSRVNEEKRLSHDFQVEDGPYGLLLVSPQGVATEYGSASSPAVVDEEGAVFFDFTPTVGGLWHSRFFGNSLLGPDKPFYVERSPVV